MTLSKTKVKITHVANGTTDYIFSYDFRIDAENDIEIYYDGVLQTPTPSFANVTGLGSEAGGQVEFSAVPPACNLTIRRNVDLTQDVDYRAYDAFPAETHEEALDYLMMVAQQQQEVIDRAYVVGVDELQPFIFNVGSIQHDSAGTTLSVFVKNAAGTFQKMLELVPDGETALYHSGVKVFETVLNGVSLDGGSLYLDGGSLYLDADRNTLLSVLGDDILALYLGAIKRFTIDSNGMTLNNLSKISFEDNNFYFIRGRNATYTGYIDVLKINANNGITLGANLHLGDAKRIQLGDSYDNAIYHEAGYNVYISGTAVSETIFQFWNGTLAEDMIRMASNGAVSLYYNNGKRFETTDAGVSVQGRGVFFRDGTDTLIASKSVAGQYAAVSLATAGIARWLLISTNEAESGGNVGSNFTIQSRADDGSYLQGFVKAWRVNPYFAGGLWEFQRHVSMGSYGIYFDPIDYDSYIAADSSDDYIKVVCGGVTSMQLTNYGLIMSAAKHLYMQNNTIIYYKNAANTQWFDMFRFNTADQLIINSAGYDTYFKGNVIIDVNAKKLYGRATGGAVTQLIQMDGADRVALSQAGTSVISHGNFVLADEIRVQWGNSVDMSMYYAGTPNIGVFSVGVDCINLAFQHWNGAVAENMCIMYPDGGIRFYYDNAKKASVEIAGLSIWDGVTESRWYYDSNVVILRNLHHGGGVALQAEDSSGVNKNILFGDTDGSTEIYAFGNKVLDVGGSGCTITSGTWNSTHLVLGNYHIWVDATGDLRIKNGAPTSDTDGTVVGSQS